MWMTNTPKIEIESRTIAAAAAAANGNTPKTKKKKKTKTKHNNINSKNDRFYYIHSNAVWRPTFRDNDSGLCYHQYKCIQHASLLTMM